MMYNSSLGEFSSNITSLVLNLCSRQSEAINSNCVGVNSKKISACLRMLAKDIVALRDGYGLSVFADRGLSSRISAALTRHHPAGTIVFAPTTRAAATNPGVAKR